MALVMCSTHGSAPHAEVAECTYPHEVAPSGREPSMTAAETLDPRQAV